jgi:hypothetical protein
MKHWESSERLYKILTWMKGRCRNQANKSYKNYGGRGIAICEEWNDYHKFREWAFANGYREDLTIERINNNGNYEPTNCTWISRAEQQKNKRNIRATTLFGRTQTFTDWAKELGVKRKTVYGRIARGWTEEAAFTQPTNTKHRSKTDKPTPADIAAAREAGKGEGK